MLQFLKRFTRAVQSPKIEVVANVEIESDADYRRRLLLGCRPKHVARLYVAGPHELDAIGKIYDLPRRGWR